MPSPANGEGDVRTAAGAGRAAGAALGRGPVPRLAAGGRVCGPGVWPPHREGSFPFSHTVPGTATHHVSDETHLAQPILKTRLAYLWNLDVS